jgi:hypothetical protein
LKLAYVLPGLSADSEAFLGSLLLLVRSFTLGETDEIGGASAGSMKQPTTSQNWGRQRLEENASSNSALILGN